MQAASANPDSDHRPRSVTDGAPAVPGHAAAWRSQGPARPPALTGTGIRGYVCVVLAAALWASCGTFGKYLFESGIRPIELVQFRVTFAAILTGVGLCLLRRAFVLPRRRDLPYLFLLGGVVMAFMQTSYFLAISKIQVAAAILLQYLSPILVAVFAMVFWRERASGLKLLALFLALAGCYLVVGGYNLAFLKLNRLGILWGLLSAIAFASYTLLGERGMHRYDPWSLLFFALLFAAVSLNVVSRPFGWLAAHYGLKQYLGLGYIVVFGTIAPFGLYYMGVNYIRSTRTIITATLEPIAAAVMAFVLLGEVLAPLQMGGGVLVIAAIMLLQLRKEQDGLAPALIRGRHTEDAQAPSRAP